MLAPLVMGHTVGNGRLGIHSRTVEEAGRVKRADLANLLVPTLGGAPVEGWPTVLDPAIAWDGSDFLSDEQYTRILSKVEVEEVEAALRYFKGKLAPVLIVCYN